MAHATTEYSMLRMIPQGHLTPERAVSSDVAWTANH